jgi:D-3-phosphoglycerate dehydrogenase
MNKNTYLVQTLNKISPLGLEKFPRDLYEIASEIIHPDAIIVRSHEMNSTELPPSLKAIVRAGTGVNNIPVEMCTQRGIVVFNTPGANANSVKELVLTGLLISSRNVIPGIQWARTLAGKGHNVSQLVEKGKGQFAGPEIKGKTLGVIGLGTIGVMVANDAAALGMNVFGYDPFISVDSAWGLSRNIKKARGFESLLADSDYITLHVPLTSETQGMIYHSRFAMMKKGVRLLNFARGGLIQKHDLKEAIKTGIVAAFVTDFPDEELLQMENVICIPHLGASSPEAEDNCAIMAVNQIREFLEKGNIHNSVNFPTCEMDITGEKRIVIANRNIPTMVGQITAVLADQGINIADMLNRSKGNVAYTIIDIDSEISEKSIEKIRNIEGVLMVRII